MKRKEEIINNLRDENLDVQVKLSKEIEEESNMSEHFKNQNIELQNLIEDLENNLNQKNNELELSKNELHELRLKLSNDD